MAGRKGSLKASKPDEREMEARKKSAKKPAKTDAPPWGDADEDAKASDSQPDVPDWGGDGNAKAVKKQRASSKTKSAAKSSQKPKFAYSDEGPPESPPARSRAARTEHLSQRAAPRDDKLTLTVTVDGGDDEQFDLLCDGRAYWGGYEAPYRFELGLTPGEHELRIRQRHALDRQPSRFVPLALELMLGDGLKYEYGPYCAALDARIDISADAKLSVKYALDGRVGRYGGRAAFTCSAGRGLDCEVVDTLMSSTPRLRRRWITANCLTLGALMLIALSIVALGAYMAVRPGGSVGGGVLIGLMGLLMALGCAGVTGAVHSALDGEYAPEMDFPKPKQKRKRSANADEQPDDADGTPDSDAPSKPKRKRASTKKPRAKSNAAQENDYDGAYDDADEMGEFEEAGLSTADLSPDQLKAAKKQLMRKLGGEDEE